MHSLVQHRWDWLGFFWSDNFSFWLGLSLVAASSAASSIQFPAFNSAIAVLVPKDDLGRASGLAQFGYGVAQLIGPPLGGLLLPEIEISGVILCDVLSFSSAIVLLSFTKIPHAQGVQKQRRRARRGQYLEDIRFSVAYLWSRPGLLGNLLLQGIMNLSLGVAIVAVTPLVLSIATEKELGLILSASGFGILAGGLCMTLMKAPKSSGEDHRPRPHPPRRCLYGHVSFADGPCAHGYRSLRRIHDAHHLHVQ